MPTRKARRGGLILVSPPAFDPYLDSPAGSDASILEPPSISHMASRDRAQSITNSIANELMDLCDAQDPGLEFTNPWPDEGGDAKENAVPESDVEPDWPFEVRI